MSRIYWNMMLLSLVIDYALKQQYNIGQGVVYGEDDLKLAKTNPNIPEGTYHCGKQVLKYCAYHVEDVTNEP
jgi:hypothetical protein